MATPQLSPGVLTREVDLTVGRAENVLDNIGAIAGPFPIGPVEDPTDVATEQELIAEFGKPSNNNGQYGYWLAASSFLSYGGVLKVVRTDGSNLKNASVGFASTGHTAPKIKNYEDYQDNYSSDSVDWAFAAKTPGEWGNGIKVCVIDNLADQTVTVGSASTVAVGNGFKVTLTGVTIPGTDGTTTTFTGYLKGIVTGVDAANNKVDLKVLGRVDDATSTFTAVEYAEGVIGASVAATNSVTFVNSSGVGVATETASAVVDWYDQQTLGLTNSTVYWKNIAPRPVTSTFSAERSGSGDSLHVAIYDDEGKVTGIQGNLLEKHTFLSKSTDAISAVNSPLKVYYKGYIADRSEYVYQGANLGDEDDSVNGTTATATGFTGSWTPVTTGAGAWNQLAQGVTFNAIGSVTYSLSSGADYGATGGMTATLGELISGYALFSNKDEVEVDFLIGGPGCSTKDESKAKANYLISIANQRKDCMTTISPHKADVVDVANSDTATDNVISFYSSLTSSSYAVFDTGYKYMYDRFNDRFRYVPTNGDVAGLMVRTNIVAYPWFSPAGLQRGTLNNAIKLAFNPSKAQRDRLYPKRINSIVNQSGSGILLFGDKTALAVSSAFDRINVRRLFLTVEQALQKAAESQLFELNDQITRANFVNIVEPYLRDIEAKRGLYGFLVVCDETNNTPDIVDNNEFRADIFLKPAKSINFVTLTFVATRTGVSFEEVAGRV